MHCLRAGALAALLLVMLLGGPRVGGAPPPSVPELGAFCEGDGWEPLEPEDVPEEVVTGAMEIAWSYLADVHQVYFRWRNCTLHSELDRDVEACRKVR